MTRGTHQIGAFAAAVAALALLQPIAETSPPSGALPPLLERLAGLLGLAGPDLPFHWPVGAAYLVVALLGGVAPDLDKSQRFGARVLASRLLGGHRHLSHSLLGVALAVALVGAALHLLGRLVAYPAGLLTLGFAAGYLSHLLLDGLTPGGVPWLFPWRAPFGVMPTGVVSARTLPGGLLRPRTGGLVEQLVVVPGLLALVAWLGHRFGAFLAGLWR